VSLLIKKNINILKIKNFKYYFFKKKKKKKKKGVLAATPFGEGGREWPPNSIFFLKKKT